MEKQVPQRQTNRSITSFIIVNNLFILYCILYREINFNALLYLFYFDIAISALFNIAKAEQAPINTNQNNDLKYAGELTYWDERKYRGKSEYIFTVGNLILLGATLMYASVVPQMITIEIKVNAEQILENFPFHNNWFLACLTATLLQHAASHFYFLKSGISKRIFFEEWIRIDYIKYWLFFVFVIVGSVLTAFLNTFYNDSTLPGILTFSMLYFFMKTFNEIRDRKKATWQEDVSI